MNLDLNKLNSMTKYPSILTYHKMEGKGILTDEVNFDYDGNDIYLFEKVDGENTRIVFVVADGNIDYFIGSREELLYAKGDRVINKKCNMVETLKPMADRLVNKLNCNDGVFVLYQEIYGGKTPKSKQYTTDKSIDVRAFDIMWIPMNEVVELLDKDISQIALWRDNGKQPFLSVQSFNSWCLELYLNPSPILNIVYELPKSVEDISEFINDNFKTTKAGINNDGLSEGIVARTWSRNIISKIRFEDYNRTMKKRG